MDSMRKKIKELKEILKRWIKYLKWKSTFEVINVQAEDPRILPHSYYWRYPEEKVRELEKEELERIKKEIEEMRK